MALERTLAIIKPDAVAQNAIGAIIATIEHAGLRVIGLRQLRLSQAQAEVSMAFTESVPSSPSWSRS